LHRYDSILVGGTNGKGSTCIFLDSLLRAQGLKVGLFTSPHMNQFAERIRIDGEMLSPQTIIDLTAQVYPIVQASGGSFFEAVWGMATVAFAQAQVDVAIWEVGLGGRLDATNVAEPVIAGITNIGLDHTHILGQTRDAIAREKSAIFREGSPALTSDDGDGLKALQTAYTRDLMVIPPLDSTYDLGLRGPHQRRNAGLAVAIARHYGHHIDYDALTHVSWPGRCEIIDDVLLDCAHNPAGIDALSQVSTLANADSIHVIFGAVEGKDVASMAARIDAWAERVTVVTPDYPRRQCAEDVAPHFASAHVGSTVARALDQRDLHALTIVCGSGFLVAEARAHLLGIEYPECGLRTSAR